MKINFAALKSGCLKLLLAILAIGFVGVCVVVLDTICTGGVGYITTYAGRIFQNNISYSTIATGNSLEKHEAMDVYTKTSHTVEPHVLTDIIVVKKDGTDVPLFSVMQSLKGGQHLSYLPEARLVNNEVIAFCNGRLVMEQSFWTYENFICHLHTGYAPKLYCFSYADNTAKEIKLPLKYLAIHDVFSYRGATYLLAEQYHVLRSSNKNAHTSTVILKVDSSQQKATVVKTIKSSIAKNSLLKVQSLLNGDELLYPTLDGIVSLNLQDMTLKNVVPKNFGFHTDVTLAIENETLIIKQTEEKILDPATDPYGRRFDTLEYTEHYTLQFEYLKTT